MTFTTLIIIKLLCRNLGFGPLEQAEGNSREEKLNSKIEKETFRGTESQKRRTQLSLVDTAQWNYSRRSESRRTMKYNSEIIRGIPTQ